LYTPDKRIRLVPAALEADLPRLEAALDVPPPAKELILIGRRDLRSNNSWMHNSARLVKGRDRCTLLIHPRDAAARDLHDGDVVLVRSRVGAARVPVTLTDDIAPGVVSLPHGWGHGRAGAALEIAGGHAGASLNDLTDDGRVDVLSGNAALSGVPVKVERAAEA
jgi:anaerobic selenocysteine-containing dehydrogenase